jgi:hypothetical protein
MSSKLSSANPYLRDPAVRQSTVFTSVSTSSAIEGIHAPFREMGVAATGTGSASDRTELPSKRRLIPVKF